MTPAQFIEEIKSTKRRSLYLLTGGEPAALGRCLEAATEAVDPQFRDFNYQTLSLEAGEAGRLVSEALTGAFFVPPRIVVSRNPPFVAEDWEVLFNYLDRPSDNVIILIMEKVVDARLKFFKLVKKKGLEVECYPPKGAALNRWLAEEFKARGVEATTGVCALIIERAGNDLETLLGEAEKLSLYLGVGGRLTIDLVRSLVSLSPEGNVFRLGEALGGRDHRQALIDIIELLTTENHMMVIAMMVRHFRLMLQIKTRQASQETRNLPSTEAHSLGIHPFVLQKTQGQAAAWGWRELIEALAALEEAQRTLVTIPTPANLVLEQLALKLSL